MLLITRFCENDYAIMQFVDFYAMMEKTHDRSNNLDFLQSVRPLQSK